MTENQKDPARPAKRLSWMYLLPWVGAVGWVGITAVRYVLGTTRFDWAGFLGAVTGAALTAFVFAAIAAMVLGAGFVVAVALWSMLRQGAARIAALGRVQK